MSALNQVLIMSDDNERIGSITAIINAYILLPVLFMLAGFNIIGLWTVFIIVSIVNIVSLMLIKPFDYNASNKHGSYVSNDVYMNNENMIDYSNVFMHVE